MISRKSLQLLAGLIALPLMAFAGGTVKGKVVLTGDIPERPVLNIPTFQAGQCNHEKGEKHLDNALIVSKDRGIKNYVITLTKEGDSVKALDKIVHNQVKCRFEVPVLIVPVGSTVEFKNSDSTIHNVNVTAFKNKSFNKAIIGNGTTTHKFDKSETNISVRCDFHPWMRANISVVETNYFALSDANGNFEIKDIPAGEYKFKAWHPVMKTAKTKDMNLDSTTVKIEDGKTLDIQIKKANKK